MWHHDVTNARTCQFFRRLFDRLPIQISTSDLHHRILRKKIYHIRAYDFGELLHLRQATHVANRDRATTATKQLAAKLPAAQSRSLTLASEKGASSWVTALPLSCHGFVLHKAAFRDALCLRYGWQPQSLPSQCTC